MTYYLDYRGPTGSDGKGEEIPIEALERTPVLRAAEVGITKELAEARELFQAASPARVGNGEVEELKRPPKGAMGKLLISSLPASDPAHLAPHVGELRGERKLAPPTDSKSFMLEGHKLGCGELADNLGDAAADHRILNPTGGVPL